MIVDISRFADAPIAALRHFERRRTTSMARLAAVTRRLREEIDARAQAARLAMAEAAWAEAGWAEAYRNDVVRPEAA